MMKGKTYLIVFLIIMLLSSCISVPKVPTEFDMRLRSEVEKIINESLKFDPYENNIYFINEESENNISKVYEEYLNSLRTELENGTTYYGGYLSFKSEKPNPQQYLTTEYLRNILKSDFKVSDDDLNKAVKSLYLHGWALFKNGHAIENGDLASYDVPIKVIFVRLWRGSTSKLDISYPYFSVVLRSPHQTNKKERDSIQKSVSTDIKERLEKLAELKNNGTITEEEYKIQRERILNGL